MKLATIKDGSRDGQLAVVSRDLLSAHYAAGIATRMQQLLDDWNYLSPQLEDLYTTLNQGKARHAFPFDPRLAMAPLPRAHQWADGSSYPNHLALLRRARGAEPPAQDGTPPMVQRAGDDFLGPTDDARVADEAWGIDFEGELAVITGDVAMGATPEQALEGVRLVMLANDWTLRELVPAEVARGWGLLQSKPATAFGPVAATPDELGAAWHGGRAHLVLECRRDDRVVGRCETGPEMAHPFGELIAHLARTRRVRAGSIVGSGTVSNEDPGRGACCLAELRARESLRDGSAATPWLRHGERVRIEACDADGHSVFGAIEQRVAPAGGGG